jgi:predicted helicase
MDSYEDCKKQIYSLIYQSLNKDSNIFEHLNDLFKIYYERPVNNMIDLKKRNAKNKGFLFEVFCVLYLQKKGYNCWLLKDVPESILKECNLTKQDLGIDLIATKQKNEEKILYFAVQCKYRSPSKNSLKQTVHRVLWKDISTFLSLASRTGPKEGWIKQIIMTNAETVLWKGKKTSKDYTIGKRSFMKHSKIFWTNFIKENNDTIKVNEISIIDDEEEIKQKIQKDKDTKQKRLEWLNKI